MLERLFLGPVAAVVDALLTTASPTESLAVGGRVRLDALLSTRARLIVVDAKAKPLRRVKGVAVVALPDALPLVPRCLSGLVCTQPETPEQLRELLSYLRDRGTIVMLGAGSEQRASGLALAGGMMDIGQCRAGRTLLTSGVAAHFDSN